MAHRKVTFETIPEESENESDVSTSTVEETPALNPHHPYWKTHRMSGFYDDTENSSNGSNESNHSGENTHSSSSSQHESSTPPGKSTHKQSGKTSGRKTTHPRRFNQVRREIIRLMNSTNLLIPRLPFQRYVG